MDQWFKEIGVEAYIATVDGSAGTKGFVTDVICEKQIAGGLFPRLRPYANAPRSLPGARLARGSEHREQNGMRIRCLHVLQRRDPRDGSKRICKRRTGVQKGGTDMEVSDMKRDLSVTLSGVTLQNPVVPASGCFGFGYGMAEFYDIDILGSISFKGTTRDSRFGNPLPRVAECASGLINSVGLQNPGIDMVIAEELPKMRAVFHQPIIANISGFAIDEYVECCEKNRQRGASGHHRAQRELPQRPRRRNEFRHMLRVCGRSCEKRLKSYHQTPLCETHPECHRHSVDRPLGC